MRTTAEAGPKIFSPPYYDRLFEIEEAHWWSVGMREIAEMLLRARLRPGPLDVLDAGCGTGAAIAWLERFALGRPVRGIDAAPEAIEYCQRRGHGDVRLGSVTALPWEDGSFDLVHSGDVLQHLPVDDGPARALEESYRVLRAGGHLFLRTNARPLGGARSAADYQRFDLARVRALVAGAGLEAVRCSYVNCLPSLWAEIATLRRRPLDRGHEHGEDGGLQIRPYPPSLRWLNRAMLGVLRAEGRLIARFGCRLPYGHTLVCLARRRG